MIGLNPAKLRQRRIAGSAQWTVVKPQPAQRALRRFAIRVLVLLFVVTCTATARSVDNGLTWTDYQVHFSFGKVHSGLALLRDERLLMTYATRIGEVVGELYHGIVSP